MDRTLQKGLHRPPELAPKSVRGGRGIPGAGEDCLSPQGEFRSLGRNTPCASFPDVLELRGLMGSPRSERLVRNGSRGQATISRFTPPPS